MKKILIIITLFAGFCSLQSQDREPRNMRLTYLGNVNYSIIIDLPQNIPFSYSVF